MKYYKVYAKPIQNSNEPVYVQSIIAKNKKAACFSVMNMPDNKGIYKLDSYFAVMEVKV